MSASEVLMPTSELLTSTSTRDLDRFCWLRGSGPGRVGFDLRDPNTICSDRVGSLAGLITQTQHEFEFGFENFKPTTRLKLLLS